MEPDQSENPKAEEITAENKELSFRLNEPVTSALNISLLTNASAGEGDSMSFIVLGKDSIETQASILASYVDIQQKSMSVDYKSMVSSLSTTELQSRLTEMLQENVKLKETLKQNNEAMKQQFNTLAMWQEEVTKVHQNHKQKFAETKELVNHLKKENTALKTKLSHLQQTEDTGYEAININDSDAGNASTNQAELEQNMPFSDSLSKMDTQNSAKKYDGEVQQKLQQLNVEKELELAMKSLSYNDKHAKPVEILKCSEACLAKDQEIVCLKESINLLEQKLQSVLTPVKLYDLSETSSNVNRQKFVQNMKQYKDMLQELTECFIAQIGHFTVMEKGLKEITDIFRLDDDNSIIQCKEKLYQCCKQLADEQVNIITDRQTLIKSQKQFQKIFCDYNSILYELEITIDENTKLNVLNNTSARENLQRLEELEQIKCDQQSLETERRIFDQEKDSVEKEKKSLEQQKKSLDMERISLHDERRLLEQEKIDLNEEKMSLDHQSKLYDDCERGLQNEKKGLQVCYEQLLSETNSLRREIKEKNVKFQKITDQLLRSAEEMQLLRSQLLLYEDDFKQERKLAQALLEEKNELNTELLKQIEFNKQLHESVSSGKLNQTSEHQSGDKYNGRARDGNATVREKLNRKYIFRLFPKMNNWQYVQNVKWRFRIYQI